MLLSAFTWVTYWLTGTDKSGVAGKGAAMAGIAALPSSAVMASVRQAMFLFISNPSYFFVVHAELLSGHYHQTSA